MNLTVRDGTAGTRTAKVAEAAEAGRPSEWEPRPFPQSWWQTRQDREALELERRGAGTALITMYAGGAMSTATLIERL